MKLPNVDVEGEKGRAAREYELYQSPGSGIIVK
jgi:hypothetical protein